MKTEVIVHKVFQFVDVDYNIDTSSSKREASRDAMSNVEEVWSVRVHRTDFEYSEYTAYSKKEADVIAKLLKGGATASGPTWNSKTKENRDD